MLDLGLPSRPLPIVLRRRDDTSNPSASPIEAATAEARACCCYFTCGTLLWCSHARTTTAIAAAAAVSTATTTGGARASGPASVDARRSSALSGGIFAEIVAEAPSHPSAEFAEEFAERAPRGAVVVPRGAETEVRAVVVESSDDRLVSPRLLLWLLDASPRLLLWRVEPREVGWRIEWRAECLTDRRPRHDSRPAPSTWRTDSRPPLSTWRLSVNEPRSTHETRHDALRATVPRGVRTKTSPSSSASSCATWTATAPSE